MANMDKQELINAIELAKKNLLSAELALDKYEAVAANNVYPTIDEALADIEDKLNAKADRDCEGAHNCGNDEYEQMFMVGGVTYIALLKVEYNRHDKTYYYVDGTDFEWKAKEATPA